MRSTDKKSEAFSRFETYLESIRFAALEDCVAKEFFKELYKNKRELYLFFENNAEIIENQRGFQWKEEFYLNDKQKKILSSVLPRKDVDTSVIDESNPYAAPKAVSNQHLKLGTPWEKLEGKRRKNPFHPELGKENRREALKQIGFLVIGYPGAVSAVGALAAGGMTGYNAYKHIENPKVDRTNQIKFGIKATGALSAFSAACFGVCAAQEKLFPHRQHQRWDIEDYRERHHNSLAKPNEGLKAISEELVGALNRQPALSR